MGKLDSNTLVLNRSWAAVQICSVRRAISLLYQGHAKVIGDDLQAYDFNDWSEVSNHMTEINADEFVASTSIRIRIPRVIVLLLYDRLPKRHVRFSRKNIFERDKFTCQYCGKRPPNKKRAIKWMEKNQLNLDHVIPRCKGGKTTWENVVTSCYDCNSKKANRTLEELGWRLINDPIKPNWKPTLNIPMRLVPHKEWVNFMDLAYWNTNLENDIENDSIESI